MPRIFQARGKAPVVGGGVSLAAAVVAHYRPPPHGARRYAVLFGPCPGTNGAIVISSNLAPFTDADGKGNVTAVVTGTAPATLQ